jgi:WD40 repeat protein
MDTANRRTLDQMSDESEHFETEFDRLVANELDDAERLALIGNITHWLRVCVAHGRYIAPASADRRALRSLLERWNSRLRDLGVYNQDTDKPADFDPQAGFVLAGVCPYPGLEPYTQTERTSFFGREGAVADCVKHLDQPGNRILLIIGASGSGKSSLAMAGVLPALAERHGGWLFAPRVTPGLQPMRKLAAAVAGAIDRADLEGEISRALRANPAAARATIARLCGDRPLVLFVDQFEELLTMARDGAEQAAVAEIIETITAPDPPSTAFACRVLLTMRTDHLARFENNHRLKGLYTRLVGERNQNYLSPIGFDDIKRAIKGPADAVGLRFMPTTLIDKLASQTAHLSNGLPLLQYALRRLWDTRPVNAEREPLDLITEEMVDRLPDVERALGAVADGIFATFSRLQRQICERLLLELVLLDDSFEEPLRRRRVEAELVEVLESRFVVPTDIEHVIGTFVTAGLLRRFGDGPNRRLEIAHEALLRHWDQIYRLLTGADVKERLHLVKQINREAGDWAGHGQSADYLNLKGERLARAIDYSQDGWLAEAQAAAYVEACFAHQETQRIKEEQAREEEQRADHARELALAAEAELDLNAQRSLLLAIEAVTTLDGEVLPEVESALRSAVRASRVTCLVKAYGLSLFTAAAFTLDGTMLVLGDAEGGVTFWDIASGRQHGAMFPHVDAVKGIAFSPDGKCLATGSTDGRVVISDFTGKALHVLTGHADGVTGLAFSRPDGRFLVTGSEDASVRLWDVATGAPIGEPLYGHASGIKALAFGRDHRQLVTAGNNGSVVLWDALRGTIVYSFEVGTLFDIDLSADGSLLAIATSNNVEIWDLATRSRRWTLSGHTNSIVQVRFSPDRRYVASAGYDSMVCVWRLPGAADGPEEPVEMAVRLRPDPTLDSRPGFITALAFGPKSDSVAAASLGGTATVWNIAGGGELLTLPAFDRAVARVAFSADGERIAATDRSQRPFLARTVSGGVWENPFQGEHQRGHAIAFGSTGVFAMAAGKDVLVAIPGATSPLRLSGHFGEINDIAFSPDGTRALSGSDDGTAMVWELPSGNRLGTLEGHQTGGVTTVAWSGDGRTLATGGEDKKIILWRADTFDETQRLENHVLGILDLAFTPDSTGLASGSKDKTARVWDVASGEQLAVFNVHTDVVYAVAMHGDRLATAADDGIRLWNLKTRAPIPVFPTRSQGARSLAFSGDGRYLAAGARDGVVRVYAMRRSELLELARKHVHRAWTRDELQWFLHRDEGPQTAWDRLDAALARYAAFDIKAAEEQVAAARAADGADREAIDAEVAVRLPTFLVWGAGKTVVDPESEGGEETNRIALEGLVAAARRLESGGFDPHSHWLALLQYRQIKQARELAREGEVDRSIELFTSARDQGWSMMNDPARVAVHLRTVSTLFGDRAPARTPEEQQALASSMDEALEQFPELRPGHRVAANFHAGRGEYEEAEKHYLEEARGKEHSATPLVLASNLALEQVDKGNPRVKPSLRMSSSIGRLVARMSP